MPWTKKSPEFILEGPNVNKILHKKGFPRALEFTILYPVIKKNLKKEFKNGTFTANYYASVR